MIPDEKTIHKLWEKYNLPEYKRIHSAMVRTIALHIARKINEKNPIHPVNESLLASSVLLHDIDKNIEKLEGERHPDTGVRILKSEGMEEVAEVIRTHPLHMILQPDTAPKTIEQQLLFIADKMTKQGFVGLSKRFQLWREEDADEISRDILDRSYSKVMALRDEVFRRAGITENDLMALMKQQQP